MTCGSLLNAIEQVRLAGSSHEAEVVGGGEVRLVNHVHHDETFAFITNSLMTS